MIEADNQPRMHPNLLKAFFGAHADDCECSLCDPRPSRRPGARADAEQLIAEYHRNVNK